ncbi:MAG: heavy-metal-associated domain-containing protein [Acidobacteriota bacterium]|jgi:mercuric ion binding protein|nr:heavy-metal-associated domain-containing protein [Acidobacteriota bacterium]
MRRFFNVVATLWPALFFCLAAVAPSGAAPAREQDGATGGGAKLVKVVIDVKDMDCSLCVTAINQALRKTEGVVKAKASLKKKQAEVVVPEGFPAEKLLDAIKRTGYTGEVAKVTPTGDEPGVP